MLFWRAIIQSAIEQLTTQAGQVLLWKPFIQIKRQERQLMGIVVAKVESHGGEPLSSTEFTWNILNHSRLHKKYRAAIRGTGYYFPRA